MAKVYTKHAHINKPANPWAICTAMVGRHDKAKYEKCVKGVKIKNDRGYFFSTGAPRSPINGKDLGMWAFLGIGLLALPMILGNGLNNGTQPPTV